jgi:hypothetical protein
VSFLYGYEKTPVWEGRIKRTPTEGILCAFGIEAFSAAKRV